MKVLLAPGSYLFTDKIGSEPLWATILVNAISHKVDSLDVIVGSSDFINLNSNVRIFSIYTQRSTSIVMEFIKRSLFYSLVTIKALRFGIDNYEVVQHMMPLSFSTINPLFFICKLFYPHTKLILGPAISPYQKTFREDLDIGLIGKKTSGFSKWLITECFFLLFPVVKRISIGMWNMADEIICVSQSSANYYSKYVNPKKITIIPMGVPQLAKMSTPKYHPPLILTAGAMIKRKGHHILLEACTILSQKHIDFKLVIAGTGFEQANLESYIRSHNLSSYVKFVGQISHDQMPKLYSQSDVFCLPSLDESYPTVLMEALTLGLPIVASDVGSVKEIIGNAGIVVPPEDSNKLADGLEKVLSPKNLSDFKTKADSRGQKFLINNVIQKYISLYQ